MLAPPKPPQDELDALVKEAHARQLRRRLLAATTIAVVTGNGARLLCRSRERRATEQRRR
jgi:hypothetical protein